MADDELVDVAVGDHPVDAEAASDEDFNEYVAGADERLEAMRAREAELLAAEEASRAAENAPEPVYGDIARMSNDDFDALMEDPDRFGPDPAVVAGTRVILADGTEEIFPEEDLIRAPAWMAESDEEFSKRMAAVPYGELPEELV